MRYKEIKTAAGSLHIANAAIGSAVKMGGLSKNELFELFDMYIASGGNCIDTARAYGAGQAEALIGEYLQIRKNRDKLLISTKCCHPAGSGASRLTQRDMEEDLDASMRALGIDYVDIYWLHKDDESIPVESIMDSVNALLRTGKIGAIGCSNWHTGRIAAANRYARLTGQRGFDLSQIQWSLAESEEKLFQQFSAVLMDDVSYGWYYKNEMPVFAFSPQAQGFFSKAATGGVESLSEMLQTCYANPNNLIRLERVKEIAAREHVPVSVPVLAYLMNNKLPCVPVFGATSRQMLQETLLAADFAMSAEEADALFQIQGSSE